jgi:MoaA/NifB/PqqE/SkfB family radical SAM enzyme
VDAYSLIASIARMYGRIPARTSLLRGWAPPPLFLVLELTYRCNLRCPYCYLLDPGRARTEDPDNAELTAQEIGSVIDQTPPWTLILLSGGEIQVRADLPEILQTVIKRRRCHIFTNGTLVTTEDAAEWVRLGVSSIAISLEGPEDVHDSLRGVGTFDRTLAGIKALVEQRTMQRKKTPRINLKTTILAGNAGCLSDCVRIAEAAGVDYCTFQVLNTTTRLGGRSLQTSLNYSGYPPAINDFPLHLLDQQLQAIERLASTSTVKIRILPALPRSSVLSHYDNRLRIRDYNCLSPWTVSYVSPCGDVYPCLNFRAGSVREEPLRRIWNNRRYRQFRREILESGLFPDCRGCCDLLQRG